MTLFSGLGATSYTSQAVIGATYVASTAYQAWFWRAPRSIQWWAVWALSTIATTISFWWLVRRQHLTVAQASVFSDLLVFTIWYAALIVSAQSVDVGQRIGLALIFGGGWLVLR